DRRLGCDAALGVAFARGRDGAPWYATLRAWSARFRAHERLCFRCRRARRASEPRAPGAARARHGVARPLAHERPRQEGEAARQGSHPARAARLVRIAREAPRRATEPRAAAAGG